MKGSSFPEETSQKNSVSKSSSGISLNIIIFVLSFLILFLIYSLIAQIFDTLKSEEQESAQTFLPAQIQIEVLNGCGVAGIANTFTESLRAKGFDVVNKGNYSSFDLDNTLLIDRSDNPVKTSIVAEAIGIDKLFIINQYNDQYFLDVTLIIGKDFNSLLKNN